jgi:hypothetical protein
MSCNFSAHLPLVCLAPLSLHLPPQPPLSALHPLEFLLQLPLQFLARVGEVLDVVLGGLELGLEGLAELFVVGEEGFGGGSGWRAVNATRMSDNCGGGRREVYARVGVCHRVPIGVLVKREGDEVERRLRERERVASSTGSGGTRWLVVVVACSVL